MVEHYVNQIIDSIPEGYILKYHLIESLNDVIDSSKYRAPEALYLSFKEVEMFVNHCVFKMYKSVSSEELPDWVKNIINILYDFHNNLQRVVNA